MAAPAARSLQRDASKASTVTSAGIRTVPSAGAGVDDARGGINGRSNVAVLPSGTFLIGVE